MLADVLDIRSWLHDDRQTPIAVRLERDREIGRQFSDNNDLEKLLTWKAAVGAIKNGARVEQLRRLCVLVLLCVGIVLGASVAGVAFAYSGDYPVNLFALLGVTVVIPLILLLFTLLLLPGRLPGIAGLQEILSGMNVGRWTTNWLDRFSGLNIFSQDSRYSRWQLVVFSQWLAIGYFVGVLSMAWILIAFTDLAFGWSTTLHVDSGNVHRLFTTLASPWLNLLPSATPSLELVESSRYYRLEGGGPLPDSAILGDWWPFVLMSVFLYGALPRLLLLGFGLYRLGAATEAMLLDDPEVRRLLDRLNTPTISYRGQTDKDEPQDSIGQSKVAPHKPLDAEVQIIIWNNSVSAEFANKWLRKRLGKSAGGLLNLGELQSESELADAVRSLVGVHQIMLFTKGWEPPILAFRDFILLLRKVLNAKVNIDVVPIDVDATSVRLSHRQVWADMLIANRDPNLYVVEADE